ncbi:ABC transporter ATP-binding protein [Aquabacterium sp.]|uniref:ABC transporter ATP-binding protein n=1 Tax=Aquabacterium sp. TaxID=1872578 RepID=UPI003783DD90
MNEATGSPLLRVEGVSRRFADGDVQALDGVSFSASAGETLALTGPSGCGKSTLLSLIGLLDQPDRGRILIGGQDLARVRQASAFRARHLGFVFQYHHMVPTMTLQENVEAPMLALGLPRAARRDRAAELLQAVGLAPRAGFLPRHVSGGERQRAAVARALANRPAIVLADEPTGSLDSRNGQRVVELLITQARAEGALVLVASHNPEVAAALQRRIALRDGVCVADDRERLRPAPPQGLASVFSSTVR